MPTSAKTAAKKAPAKKATVKTAAAPAKKAAAPKVAAKKVAAKKVAAKKVAAKTTGAPSPIKDTFTKASLATHLSERAAVDLKAVKAVLGALEDTILGSIHKKGAGEFTLSGLLKISAQAVPAKKKRFGKDPFSGEERWFPAKPASVRIKARPLKKLKDAAA
ncbi:HU family DNA-binding protein [Caballeronia glebae]|jgi:nucleoid DNA-binding protein|uniref:DNA-binding protein n=1 Tax=Caballeronia glebae TaxID=1777143 RepID=A0A158BB94_9BURK|nr:HU family DNA-binding protein [Caballeronia glebae]SAK67299.1 DNA-binding protein [Caballeronia glebae]